MRRIATFFILFLAIAGRPSRATTWITLDDPLAGPGGTFPSGISGHNIVGYYLGQPGGQHGFLFDGTTYTTIDAPAPAAFTWATGIDGQNIVGYYAVPTSPTTSSVHGFLLSGSTFTTLDCTLPGAVDTYPEKIDGSKVVGSYTDQGGFYHGFVYDGAAYLSLDDPLATGTRLRGVSGDRIVGSSDSRGFIYDGSQFQTLAHPLAGAQRTVGTGIDGNRVVGYYDPVPPSSQRDGFIYDGVSYMTIDDPLAGMNGVTAPADVEGDNIVGSYKDSAGKFHGFLATVPEPSAAFLWCMALRPLCFIWNRIRRSVSPATLIATS